MFNWLSIINSSIQSTKQHQLIIYLILLYVSLPSSAFATTVGYWKFESGIADVAAIGPGSIIDSSGNNNHGTPVGNPVYRNDVPVDAIPLTQNENSLSLELVDGSEVRFNSTFIFHEPGDATIEFWLKSPMLSHSGVFWTRVDDSDLSRFHLYIDADNTFGMDYRSASGEIHRLVKASIPNNMWVHLAIVRTGNIYSIYRDGKLVGESIDTNPNLPTTKDWQLSGRTGYSYIGRIDSIRFSDVALQPEEFLNAIGETNINPVAVAGTSLDQNLSIQLDASLSSDKDNDSLSYSWVIKGEPVPFSGLNVPISHLTEGNYSVILTVNDGNGGISTDSMLLAIPDTTLVSNQDTTGDLIRKLKDIREIIKYYPSSLNDDDNDDKTHEHRKTPILNLIDNVVIHIFVNNFKSAYSEMLLLEKKITNSDSKTHRRVRKPNNYTPSLELIADVISEIIVICQDCNQENISHRKH